jgi:hypothetical protein
MSTTTKSAQNTPQSSLSPLNSDSRDAGALELGVESAWTRDDTFVTGVERTDSLEVEPSASDLLPAMSVGGALGAPQNSSTPLINLDDAVHTETLLDAGAGTNESTQMSIAPLLGSVNGLGPSMLFSTENDGPEIYVHRSPSTGHLSEAVSWSDLPDNGEIGDVPEFPILRPTINSPSAPSTPRIPAALKGKGIDPEINKNPIDEMDPKD